MPGAARRRAQVLLPRGRVVPSAEFSLLDERAFVNHYNTHRPHRGLNLRPPQPSPSVGTSAPGPLGSHVQRRDRLGGLVHEYVLAA